MAQSTASPTTIKIDLKDRRLAAFLSWLLPGAGHYYQGRKFKAAIFFVCIFGTYLYGLVLGGGRVVYTPVREGGDQQVFRRFSLEWRQVQFLCQAGVGLPALPALVASQLPENGSLPLTGGRRWFMPPGSAELDELNLKLNRRFELGTVFTMIAGLLNILAICDAYGGPMLPVPKEQKRDEKSDEKADDKYAGTA